jgi:hypothetical protein
MPSHVHPRLKQLHHLVDQQRSSGKDEACDDRVEEECRQWHPQLDRAKDARAFHGSGRARLQIIRRYRRRRGRTATPNDRGNDSDPQANGRSIPPFDETVCVGVVDFAAGKPIGNRKETEDRQCDRDQERDRSISRMRFCRSAGLTPGTLAACASESGLRAASFCRDSIESVRIRS